MAEWSVSECEVVGGMRYPDGACPFACAPVVLQKKAEGEDNRFTPYLKVNGYCTPGGNLAQGVTLGVGEWEILRQGQAFGITSPLPAFPFAVWWIFRADESDERAGYVSDTEHSLIGEVQRAGGLPGGRVVLSVGVRGYLVDAKISNPLRDSWARATFQNAVEAWTTRASHAGKRIRKDAEALRLAELAFVLDRGLKEERLGLLAEIYLGQDRGKVTAGYLGMAERTKGEQFAERVRQCMYQYREQYNGGGV